MINAFDRRGWVFQHHAFLNDARVDWKGERGYNRQLAKTPFKIWHCFEKSVSLPGIQKCMRGLTVSFHKQRMIWFMLFENTKQDL